MHFKSGDYPITDAHGNKSDDLSTVTLASYPLIKPPSHICDR